MQVERLVCQLAVKVRRVEEAHAVDHVGDARLGKSATAACHRLCTHVQALGHTRALPLKVRQLLLARAQLGGWPVVAGQGAQVEHAQRAHAAGGLGGAQRRVAAAGSRSSGGTGRAARRRRRQTVAVRQGLALPEALPEQRKSAGGGGHGAAGEAAALGNCCGLSARRGHVVLDSGFPVSPSVQVTERRGETLKGASAGSLSRPAHEVIPQTLGAHRCYFSAARCFPSAFSTFLQASVQSFQEVRLCNSPWRCLHGLLWLRGA